MNKYDLKQIHYFPIIANKSYVPNENLRLQVYGFVLNSNTFQITEYTIYNKTTFISRWNAMNNASFFRRGCRAVSEVFTDSVYSFRKYFSQVFNYNTANDTFDLSGSIFNVPNNTYLLLDVFDFYCPLEGCAMINGIRKNTGSPFSLVVNDVYGFNFTITLNNFISECSLPNIIFSQISIPVNVGQFINNFRNGIEI